MKAAGVDAVLLANVILGPNRRQIDLIVATAATAIVVEIKAYIHPVHGGVNGPWCLEQDDGSRRDLDGSNPYQQALENRFTVTDCLRNVEGVDVRDAVGGMLCLYPAAPNGSAIPTGDFKAAIGGYADLVALLQTPRNNPLPLERWRAFAEAQGLKDARASPPSDADRLIAQYLAAHADLSRATLDPYVDPLFDSEDSTESLTARILNGEQMQIVGPSGSGKTSFLKQLASACAAHGNISIFIRSRDFHRDLGPLLRTDVARYTREKVPALFRAAASIGAEIIIHVDAINECPADRRADLIAALQAARINYGARIVLSGQEIIALPASLAGGTVQLPQPERDQAQRIVEAHLGRVLTASETPALEVVATAHDAAILASTLGGTHALDGRFSLYHAFTRARLKAAGIAQANGGLANLATAMRTGFVAAMPIAAAERVIDPQDVTTLEKAHAAGLLWREAGRVGFRHDLIGDFFAADAILRRADTPGALRSSARQPMNAELREFLLGGCATTAEIEALLLDAPDSRLLESALSGRAGAKAKSYVISRLRDLIAQLRQRYGDIDLALPEGVTNARELSSLVPSLADAGEDAPLDSLYLTLIPSAVSEGLLPDLLELFAQVDERLLAEADRLRELHPNVRLAWRAAAYSTVYGMHHTAGGPRHLQNLIHAIPNSWAQREERNTQLRLAAHLDEFETFGVGQLFLLVAMLRCTLGEPMPTRFPELLRHVWRTQVYHLRLMICDIIRFRGSELTNADRQAVREELDSFLSDNPFMNSTVLDALEGVGGLEHDFSVDAAVQEYEDMLDLPESPEACGLAISAVTRTYDHPYADIYWEAFYDVLSVEKRQALLLRGLRERPGDPWFINDILRALRRDPTPEAEPELQRLALGPLLEGHSHQFAIVAYAEAIGLLATMDLPLDPPQPAPPDMTMRAWFAAAPLIHVLNGGNGTPSTDALVACGAANAFDVVQRLRREARNVGFGGHPDIAFERLWPDMVHQLARVVLAPHYTAASAFARFQFGRSLEEDHVDAALQLMATVGRPTDLRLVEDWLDHPRHGEQALATARSLEAERASGSAAT
ncbi:NERD domain-containing protein [Sphingosinicella xenopeptidilytica]|uniref:NERD domain-containing protein n=1 Tax=Sphingosinicella xenopeptidilytica TaxID=364098 RepID=A0ABW3C9S9_SPHXN